PDDTRSLERRDQLPHPELPPHVLAPGEQRGHQHDPRKLTGLAELRRLRLEPDSVRLRVHDPVTPEALQPVVPRDPKAEAGRSGGSCRRENRPVQVRNRHGANRGRRNGRVGERRRRRAHGHVRRQRTGLAPGPRQRHVQPPVRPSRDVFVPLYPPSVHERRGDRPVNGRGRGKGEGEMPDDLDCLLERLGRVLAEGAPGRLAVPFPAAEVYERLVPYRSNRSTLRVATHQDYEMAVLRLLSGERGYVSLDPGEVQEAL